MFYDVIMHHPKQTAPEFNGERFARALAGAQRFVVSPSVVRAAHAVAQSKPSSIHTAINLARLPYPTTWFEWQSDAYFQAAGIASQDDRVSVRRETTGDFLVTMREGMLLEQQERGFVASSVWDQGRENPKGWMVSPLFAIVTRRREDLASKFSSYQAAASYEVYARETAAKFWDRPTERAALAELFQLFYISGPHPDYRRRFTPEELAPFQAGWSGGIKPIFLIALLLLLNSRNGVETQLIKHEKLNRARARRRQPPLADYRIVDLRLGKARSAAGDAAGLTAAQKRQHLCRGHFKVRRTGIFWWSPHIRGAGQPPLERPHYRVA